MRKRITITALLLLLTTSFCHAQALTLAEADTIIGVLSVVVIVLLVLGSFGRVNKEKPFTNPGFNQQLLADFMGVDVETFCQLVPRYKDPERTLDYINSLRAEYAAKILMEHSDCSMDDMASKCGFKNSAAFNSAFKFAFGITPTEYVHGMSTMFKKKPLS